ncbi:MAG TPA: AAA family ATPase, partial [Agitococcus sp.]|nr:AAA family ATPase [Agitococcus sp.]
MTTNNTTSNESTAKFRLNSLQLSGFKSIAATGQKIDFGDVTVLLGANGCGKSNLISFFKML